MLQKPHITEPWMYFVLPSSHELRLYFQSDLYYVLSVFPEPQDPLESFDANYRNQMFHTPPFLG